MKELSIEEKAKRYDEAIERARVWKEKSGMPADRQGILDDIFPELKVSEDEEVRKALYEYFKKLKDDGDIDETWYGFSYDKILAWLEKKGEQILDNSAKTCKDEPKFKVGDIIHKIGENTIFPMVIEEIKNGEYVCDNNHSFINIKFQDDYELVEQKPAWSEEDEKGLGDALWCCKQAAIIAKDENDMGNAWYAENWLKSLKDRVLPRQQEWSEEDEKMIGNIRRIIEQDAFSNYAVDIDGDFCEKAYIDADNWLKKLKERYTWKPSDEQMKGLYWVLEFCNTSYHTNVLIELVEQLKKLREE